MVTVLRSKETTRRSRMYSSTNPRLVHPRVSVHEHEHSVKPDHVCRRSAVLKVTRRDRPSPRHVRETMPLPGAWLSYVDETLHSLSRSSLLRSLVVVAPQRVRGSVVAAVEVAALDAAINDPWEKVGVGSGGDSVNAMCRVTPLVEISDVSDDPSVVSDINEQLEEALGTWSAVINNDTDSGVSGRKPLQPGRRHQLVRVFSGNDYLGLAHHPAVKAATANVSLSCGCFMSWTPILMNFTPVFLRWRPTLEWEREHRH